ncbi:hypothetical protein Tco_0772489 [Tanacetum coccineum]|uniref:Uncharacterized protein n=1 Tax=Tanacetum coccineum TaxID=301880 RepID=A0ABQ4ZLV6_9ASTR
MEYKFQDKENSEDIFSFGRAMEDFICVVFIPDRNIETCEVTTLSSQAMNFLSSNTKDLDLSETMLELQDLSDNFELEVWSFVDMERQEFPFCFPKQCHFSRNSSSNQCDIDAHLLKYIFVSTSYQQFSLDDSPVTCDSIGKIDYNRLNTGSITNSNSYLRDILGDILGKDMYYPLTFVKPIRVSLVYKRNPKAQCYVRNHKQPTTLSYKMSQPANDDFSQHLGDGEESNHEDALDTGTAPKQQQQVIPQTTAISNIKLLILKKGEYDIWAMEMKHYLEYIDNEVWKVIQNGNSKKRISTRKDGVVRVLSPVTAAEI